MPKFTTNDIFLKRLFFTILKKKYHFKSFNEIISSCKPKISVLFFLAY